MKIGPDAQPDVPTYPHVGGAKHGFDHGENGLRVVVPEALESVPDILIWQFYNRTQRILQVFSDSHLRSPSGPGTDYCNIRPTARVILLAARSTSSASTLVIDGFQYPRCDARCSAACCPGRVFILILLYALRYSTPRESTNSTPESSNHGCFQAHAGT
jgi:hypothetical protein